MKASALETCLRQPSVLMPQWQAFCPSFKRLALRDKSVVYEQGECGDYVFQVVSGYVKLVTLDVNGNLSINSLLSAGHFFGAVTESSAPQMRYTATAKGPVVAYRSRTNEFHALVDGKPLLGRCLVISLDRQLLFARQRSDAILNDSVPQRVARMLSQLAGHHSGRCRHGHEVDFRLTQQELAELVGASRPVVSTILNDLRRQDLISYTRAFICIENLAELKRRANRF